MFVYNIMQEIKYHNDKIFYFILSINCDSFKLIALILRGVGGRVVKVVDFKPLAPHRRVFEYRQGFWILTCVEAIQLVYVGGSTQVPVRA
jgi:hypothetical protein